MARLKGFEPLTHCLEGSCSIQLSYRRNKVSHRSLVKKTNRLTANNCKFCTAKSTWSELLNEVIFFERELIT